MKKKYISPVIMVIQTNTKYCLMAGSITESTSSATEMSEGSFGARSYSSWDDNDED